MLEPRLAARQILGGRSSQQDRFRVRRVAAAGRSSDPILFAGLADGMGGHAAGERAAELAMEAAWASLAATRQFDGTALRLALAGANDAIAAELKRSPQLAGMGTTLVAALILDGTLSWISVGDSGLFLLRDGELKRLNADHSLAPVLDAMAANNEITAEEALTDPRRSALREAVMGRAISLVDTGGPFDLHADDVLLLASDGFTWPGDDWLAAHLADALAHGPEAALAAALDDIEARQDPYQDNATAVVVVCSQTD